MEINQSIGEWRVAGWRGGDVVEGGGRVGDEKTWAIERFWKCLQTPRNEYE